MSAKRESDGNACRKMEVGAAGRILEEPAATAFSSTTSAGGLKKNKSNESEMD